MSLRDASTGSGAFGTSTSCAAAPAIAVDLPPPGSPVRTTRPRRSATHASSPVARESSGSRCTFISASATSMAIGATLAPRLRRSSELAARCSSDSYVSTARCMRSSCADLVSPKVDNLTFAGRTRPSARRPTAVAATTSLSSSIVSMKSPTFGAPWSRTSRIRPASACTRRSGASGRSTATAATRSSRAVTHTRARLRVQSELRHDHAEAGYRNVVNMPPVRRRFCRQDQARGEPGSLSRRSRQ